MVHSWSISSHETKEVTSRNLGLSFFRINDKQNAIIFYRIAKLHNQANIQNVSVTCLNVVLPQGHSNVSYFSMFEIINETEIELTILSCDRYLKRYVKLLKNRMQILKSANMKSFSLVNHLSKLILTKQNIL